MRQIPFEQIEGMIEGALGVRNVDGTLQPIRLPVDDLDLHHPALRSVMTAESAAGIRLRMWTNSDSLVLDVENEENTFRPAPCAYDLVLPSGEVRRVEPEPSQGPATIRFDRLGRHGQVLEIWLPQGSGVRIRGLGIEAGAEARPAQGGRPRWVAYGSSITHCAWVPGPTETWPSIAARKLGWDLTCLGFNGACQLDPLVARAMAALPADRFTLKLGINVHNMQTLRERTFAPLVHGFIATLRDRHPITPITVISPIYSFEREDSALTEIPIHYGGEPMLGDLSIQQMRAALLDVVTVLRARGDLAIDYLDGRELLGEADAALLPDGLHPSTEGYAVVGERFAAHFAGA